MDFFGAGFLFWGCIIASLVILIYSITKRDYSYTMISGFILFPATLYFLGSPTLWWIALFPFLIFSLATYIKRKSSV